MADNYYADGAIHIDNSKNFSINGNVSSSDAMKYVSSFFADNDTIEDAKIVETASDDTFCKWLEENNRIFNLAIILNQKKVERSAEWLYYFIKEHFIQGMDNSYEWYALYRFLNKKGYLKRTEITKFVEQINLWFKEPKFTCSQSETGRYNFLSTYDVAEWPTIEKEKLKENTTMEAVRKIHMVYRNLIAIHDALP